MRELCIIKSTGEAIVIDWHTKTRSFGLAPDAQTLPLDTYAMSFIGLPEISRDDVIAVRGPGPLHTVWFMRPEGELIIGGLNSIFQIPHQQRKTYMFWQLQGGPLKFPPLVYLCENPPNGQLTAGCRAGVKVSVIPPGISQPWQNPGCTQALECVLGMRGETECPTTMDNLQGGTYKLAGLITWLKCNGAREFHPRCMLHITNPAASARNLRRPETPTIASICTMAANLRAPDSAERISFDTVTLIEREHKILRGLLDVGGK